MGGGIQCLDIIHRRPRGRVSSCRSGGLRTRYDWLVFFFYISFFSSGSFLLILLLVMMSRTILAFFFSVSSHPVHHLEPSSPFSVLPLPLSVSPYLFTPLGYSFAVFAATARSDPSHPKDTSHRKSMCSIYNISPPFAFQSEPSFRSYVVHTWSLRNY